MDGMNKALSEKKHDETYDHLPVRVWKPMPEDHTLFIVCAVISAVMVVLGVWLAWGGTIAAVSAILMIPLGVYVLFKQQRRLKMDKAIFYTEKGEMFLISLNKADKELDKYLSGELEVDLKDKFPGQSLLELAERSVICHIPIVSNIREKKENLFMMYVLYELYPYPYEGNMGIPVKRKCYENFDELLEFARSKKMH